MKRLRITVEGKTYEVEVETVGEEAGSAPAAPRAPRRANIVPPPVAAAAPAASAPAAAAGDVPSPLSGTIISIDVKIGQQVAAGEALITLEAMKMNTIVSAPTAGTVSAIHVQPTQAVEEGLPLLSLS